MGYMVPFHLDLLRAAKSPLPAAFQVLPQPRDSSPACRDNWVCLWVEGMHTQTKQRLDKVRSRQDGAHAAATVRNSVPASKVSLVSASRASSEGRKEKSPFSVLFNRMGPDLYNQSYTVSVTFRQNFPGRADDRLELAFEDTQLRKRFAIVRALTAHVGNRADYDATRPNAPSTYSMRGNSGACFGSRNDLGMYDISCPKLSHYNSYHLYWVLQKSAQAFSRHILVQRGGTTDPGHWLEGGVLGVRQKAVRLRFHMSFRPGAPAGLFSARRSTLCSPGGESPFPLMFPHRPHALSPAPRATLPQTSSQPWAPCPLSLLRVAQQRIGLRDYTFTKAGGHFSVPPLAIMKRFRVVVTICVHTFVDAGGAGDPARGDDCHPDDGGPQHQHRPFGRPKTARAYNPLPAREFGLETSYIERLMEREIYGEIPNEQFYRGELQPGAGKKTTDTYITPPFLPSKKFPIIFHVLCVKKDTSRPARGPARPHYGRGHRRHRAQCVKILLKPVAEGVKIGRVGEFQEHKVIIISAVRRSKEYDFAAHTRVRRQPAPVQRGDNTQ
ncbi:RNA helicase [Mycena kentingensis (nom. inval.)]|nr:RNA helicase [Mycena kentingensis (nom. inval.)]